MIGTFHAGELIAERYEIIGPLAEGGFAKLYRATDHQADGAEVVIKTLLRGAQDEDAAIHERFVREAQVAQLLRHPNTVRVHDFGRDQEGRFYLVMERLRGVTLDQVIASGPQPPARVEKILREILGALEEAHTLGVVHRDLKPTNIFICREAAEGSGYVKVIDFGLAKVLTYASGLSANTLTADGILVGTPGYLAPEVAQGQEVSAQADLYVAGLIAHELLTGQSAYSGTPLQKARAQGSRNPPEPGRDIAQTPLYGVVRKLMVRDPERRYTSAREALVDLEDLAEGGADLVRVPQHSRWLGVGVLLLVVVLVVIIALAL